MGIKPTGEERHHLHMFLLACEKAAKPPPTPSGLEFGLFAASRPAARTVLERGGYVETLCEILGFQPPFDAPERLTNNRAERVAQLQAWILRFPGFICLSRMATIRSGLFVFNRIQKRRKSDPLFSDDLAEFRYWHFALMAVSCVDTRRKPPALAEQRQKALCAARKLREIVGSTTILPDAGIGYQEEKTFFAVLCQMDSLTILKRRRRHDAHTDDRKYIESLTWYALHLFGDAPPALICEVAALRVKNPDKVAITKLVSKYKKSHKPLVAKV